jgi:DNA-binding PadR family transcriptional regulator
MFHAILLEGRFPGADCIDLQIYRLSDIVSRVPKPLLPERPIAPAVFQILIALADQPLHGYGIMLDIAERSGGKVKLSPGTLYGSIKQMLEDGWIEEVAGRPGVDEERRRYYRLTRDGREAARTEMARMSALLNHARLTSLRPNDG